ncbi:MAG TPA: MFS transporter, partial [Terriglobales bacterium]|nr:MFS transporter [Terriglobales bacterium]
MSRNRWVILGVCLLGFMQAHIHRVGFAPLIPTFMSDLGISYAAAATIMTAYFWTYTVAQLPVGVLTDRLGPRRMMLTFLAVLAAGVIAFPLSRTYAQSLLTRGLIGLGASGIWLPGLRLIHEWFPPQQRGRATGLFSAGGGVGGTMALMLVPVLAARLGWRWGYAITLIPLLLAFALIS